MKPKEIFIKNAIENGSVERLNILLSAAHILNCTANQYAEEAADLMAKNGLLLGRLKQLHNNFIKSADMYFREFAGMVFNEQAKMAMFNDMDSFDKVFREWSKIEKDWEPKQIEDYEQKEISDECEEKKNRV
jgi:hypothetical protein